MDAQTNSTFVMQKPDVQKFGAQTGAMPDTGYLAQAYVPYQKNGPKYDVHNGFMVGTLFPGLNLPFRNIANTREVANTPLGEIQALDFAIDELGLYLDTHPGDTEALTLRNSYIRLMKDAVSKYEKQYGPLTSDTVMEGRYDWIQNPWPWDSSAGGVK